MTTAVAAPPQATPPSKAGRESLEANRRRQARNAYLLLLPTVVAMALVVGYPIVLSIINSFQSDSSGLDPKTGQFVQGGFVGLNNYTHWLFQECRSGTQVVACAPGNLANSFWNSVFVTFFMALLILAGLQLIPEDTYEAARMDGASTVQQFFRITLPLLRPALIVAILFRTLDALRMYDLPAILTGGGGGRGDATTTLSILVVKQVQSGLNVASALSTITFIIIFLVAFLFIRVLGANISGGERKSPK